MMDDVDKDHKDISKAIHYPQCWDTAAYPTLTHALWEMVGELRAPCPSCGEKQGEM